MPWKLSGCCWGDTLASEPILPHQPPARPCVSSQRLCGDPRRPSIAGGSWGSLLEDLSWVLFLSLAPKAPFFLWKRIN